MKEHADIPSVYLRSQVSLVPTNPDISNELYRKTNGITETDGQNKQQDNLSLINHVGYCVK